MRSRNQRVNCFNDDFVVGRLRMRSSHHGNEAHCLFAKGLCELLLKYVQVSKKCTKTHKEPQRIPL